MKTADEVYFSGMFTVARIGDDEIELGPALERAGLVLVTREEWEDCSEMAAVITKGQSPTNGG